MENTIFRIILILILSIFHLHSVSGGVELDPEDDYRARIETDILKFEGIFSSGPIPFYLFQNKNGTFTEYRWSVASAENPMEGPLVFIRNNTNDDEQNVIILKRDEDRIRDGKPKTKKSFVVLAKVKDGKNAYFGIMAYIRDRDGNKSIEYDVWEPKRLFDSKTYILGLDTCSSSIFTPCKRKTMQLPQIVVQFTKDPSLSYDKPDPRPHSYFFDMEDSTEERTLIGRTIAYVAAHRDADVEDDFELELEQEIPDQPDDYQSPMDIESQRALQVIRAKIMSREELGRRGSQGGRSLGRGLFFNASAKIGFGAGGQGSFYGQGQGNGQDQGYWNGQAQGSGGGGFHANLRIGGGAQNAAKLGSGDLGEGGGDGNMVTNEKADETAGASQDYEANENYDTNGEGTADQDANAAVAGGGSGGTRKGKGQITLRQSGGGRNPKASARGKFNRRFRGQASGKFSAGMQFGGSAGGGWSSGGSYAGGGGGAGSYGGSGSGAGSYGGSGSGAGSIKQNQGPGFLLGNLGGGTSMFGDSNYNTVIDNYYKEKNQQASGQAGGGFKLSAGLNFGVGGKANFGGKGWGNSGYNSNGNNGYGGGGDNGDGNTNYEGGDGLDHYENGNQQDGNADGMGRSVQDGGDRRKGGGSHKVKIQLKDGGTSKAGSTSVMSIKFKTQITKTTKFTKKKVKKGKGKKSKTSSKGTADKTFMHTSDNEDLESSTPSDSDSESDSTGSSDDSATEGPEDSTSDAPESEPEAEAGGSGTGEGGVGRKRSVSGVERFINSKTSEVDLFSHMGWHTMGIPIMDLKSFTVADEREIFMGFGNCPYKREAENDYKRLPIMKLDEQIKFYLTPLKMQCDDKLSGIIADLVDNVGILNLGKSSGGYQFFELNRDANITKKEQLSSDERRQIYLSYAFSWFSKIYIEQLESNPTKIPYFTLAELLKDKVQQGMLPKSPYCVFRLYLAGFMLNDFLNSTHSVILTRHLMLVMKATLIKGIQDLARIRFCEDCDDAEKILLKNDVIGIVGFLEFVYRNFEDLKGSSGLSITQQYRHFMKKELNGKGTGRLLKVVDNYIGEL